MAENKSEKQKPGFLERASYVVRNAAIVFGVVALLFGSSSAVMFGAEAVGGHLLGENRKNKRQKIT